MGGQLKVPTLRPFWLYYGSKWRAAPRYPKPTNGTIIEPFAGAAGYAMRYPERRVILVDKYAVIAGIWRYLISVSPGEIRRIPVVDAVDDLPLWVPQEARDLVGFAMNHATVSPRKTLSSGLRRLRATRRRFVSWSEDMRERVASQVERIRHWRIIEGDYASVDIEATWFIDPPYNNKAGGYYVHSRLDYTTLGEWCKSRRGQVIVCENEGASWLPFRPFTTLKAGVNGRGSKEVIWTNDIIQEETNE